MMSCCEKCGMQLPEGNHYCPNCGAITDTSPAAQQAQTYQCPPKDSRYAPVGAWSFFGSILLMSLPIAGLIITIVWACNGAHHINRVHFARGVLLTYALVILAAIAAVLLLGPSAYYYFNLFT